MNKTFLPSDFILRDGVYVATIPQETHGCSEHMHMDRAMRRNASLEWENMIATYKITTDITFELYVDEPGYVRITLVQD